MPFTYSVTSGTLASGDCVSWDGHLPPVCWRTAQGGDEDQLGLLMPGGRLCGGKGVGCRERGTPGVLSLGLGLEHAVWVWSPAGSEA